MTKEIRWRIITLQIVMVVLFAFGAGLAYYAGSFTHDQITAQLAPQQIFFPKDAKSGLPDNLTQYAGQQVTTGDQAHAYADSYIGLHLKDLADGKVYSQLSAEARAEKDPAIKAQKDALVQTAFRGETLRSMLNQAWGFWTLGNIAIYAAIGLGIAALVVLGALIYELFFATKPTEEPVRTNAYAPTAS